MEGRYKKRGWFYEPERHSLAAQGVSTGSALKTTGKTLGTGIMFMMDATREGLAQQPDDSKDVLYEPVTVSTVDDELNSVKTDDVMNDVDSVVSADSTEEVDLSPEVVDFEDKDMIKPQYSSDVDNEVMDVEIAMEGSTISTGWFDRAKDALTERIKGMMQSSKENDPDSLSTHLGEIEAHKQSLQDKVGIIERVKSKVLSEQYKKEAGQDKQLENLGKLNRYIEQLKGEVSNTDHKIVVGKKQLEHIHTSPVSTVRPKSSSSIFPSFGEILNPFSMVEETPKQELRETQRAFQVKKRKEDSLDIFPSMDEIFNPEKLKK